MLASGTRLGPYEIVGLVGEGGMGQVFKARDTRLDRTVAIKMLPAELAADPLRRERFEREARNVSRLEHPNICPLYDVGEHDGHLYLVMQFLDGETLAERLLRGPLAVAHALEYGIQIAEALAAAHRAGIVHRDLKPGNVMITRTGARLLDFGLARAVPTAVSLKTTVGDRSDRVAGLTTEGTILGTLSYMAPEQIDGREIDTRADVFAFGAVHVRDGDRPQGVRRRKSGARDERDPARRTDTRVVHRAGDARRPRSADSRLHGQGSERSLAEHCGRGAPAAPPARHDERAEVRRHGRSERAGGRRALARRAECARRLDCRSDSGSGRRAPRARSHPPGDAGGSAASRACAHSPSGRHVPDRYARAFTRRSSAGGGRGRARRAAASVDSIARFGGAAAVADTDGASDPFWSPDGRTVAFFANGRLKRVPRRRLARR